MQSKYLLAGLTIGFILAGCSSQKGPKQRSLCSESWYEYVESRVPTGDGMGHGPDLGSMEWRSVVEFKLGLRDQNLLPDRSNDSWCTSIDQFLKAHDE
ncbi:hypothetical protein [Endozoicomonas numazuensis]|uniref:Lipoprotein n=1 Tax=Endozoicomonas numazuensis TaxID=1137799 RepID=A0A081NF97_9GAMM|nr:hypothetical protein [Endozoicomonas numazuensis]KEQ17120.1 hypothetical protein GZ78_14695 [Endozoicomonas numazuensis]